jgi:hypothetical protein
MLQTELLTHYHHSWSWALLEKLPIAQILKNFSAFYGTRRFTTPFTRALHWSLSWARSIHTIPSHLSKIHFNIVYQPTFWSSQWSPSFRLSRQYPICIPLLPHSCYMPCPSYPPWLDQSNYTWRRVQIMKLLIMQFSSVSCHFILSCIYRAIPYIISHELIMFGSSLVIDIKSKTKLRIFAVILL